MTDLTKFTEKADRELRWYFRQLKRLTDFCCFSSGYGSESEPFDLQTFKLSHEDWMRRYGSPEFQFSLYSYAEYLERFSDSRPIAGGVPVPVIDYFYDDNSFPEAFPDELKRHQVLAELSRFHARELRRLSYVIGEPTTVNPEENILQEYCKILLPGGGRSASSSGNSHVIFQFPDLMYFDWVKFNDIEDKLKTSPGALLHSSEYDPHIPLRFAMLPGSALGIVSSMIDGIHMDSYVQEGKFFPNNTVAELNWLSDWPDGYAVVAETVRFEADADVKNLSGPIFVYAEKLVIESGALNSLSEIFVLEGCEVIQPLGALTRVKRFKRGGPLPRPLLQRILDDLERRFRAGTMDPAEILERCNEICATEPTSATAALAYLNSGSSVEFKDWSVDGFRQGGYWGGKEDEFFRLASLYTKVQGNEDYFGNPTNSIPVLLSESLFPRVISALRKYKEYHSKQDEAVEQNLSEAQRERRLKHELENLRQEKEPALREKLAAFEAETSSITSIIEDIEDQIRTMKSISDLHGVNETLIHSIETHIWRFKDPMTDVERLEFRNIDIQIENRIIERELRLVANQIGQRNAAIALLDLVSRLSREMARFVRTRSEIATANLELSALRNREQWLNNEITYNNGGRQPPAKYGRLAEYFADKLSMSLIDLRRALTYDYKLPSERAFFGDAVYAPDPEGYEIIVSEVESKRDEIFSSFGRRGDPDDFRDDYERSFLYLTFSDHPDRRLSTNFFDVNWGAFKDTGELAVDLGLSSASEDSVAVKLPEGFANLEVQTLDIWLKPSGAAFDLTVFDPQFLVSHGVDETNTNFETGAEVRFNLSRLNLTRVVHARSAAALLGNEFDAPTSDWVLRNLATQETNYFEGLSPACKWQIKLFETDGSTFDKLMLQIDRLVLVIPYIFLSR